MAVDDDLTQRERIRGWLEARIGSCRKRRTAERRWRGLQAEPAGLDPARLMMPEMDGFAVVAALQKEPAWRDIPVIVITSLDLSAADRERAQFWRPVGAGEGHVSTGRAGRTHSPACGHEANRSSSLGLEVAS